MWDIGNSDNFKYNHYLWHIPSFVPNKYMHSDLPYLTFTLDWLIFNYLINLPKILLCHVIYLLINFQSIFIWFKILISLNYQANTEDRQLTCMIIFCSLWTSCSQNKPCNIYLLLIMMLEMPSWLYSNSNYIYPGVFSWEYISIFDLSLF